MLCLTLCELCRIEKNYFHCKLKKYVIVSYVNVVDAGGYWTNLLKRTSQWLFNCLIDNLCDVFLHILSAFFFVLNLRFKC